MINLMNVDCMEYMKTVPDKFFDLAICDPPYGIGITGKVGGVNRSDRKTTIGGVNLSRPKFTGGLMIASPQNKNTLTN
jgi:DNA modification methylase